VRADAVSGRSSNPIIDTSSGTRIPASLKALRHPQAMMSFAQNSALCNFVPPRRSAAMSAYAPSKVKSIE